jgi:hypothetical protein
MIVNLADPAVVQIKIYMYQKKKKRSEDIHPLRCA